jgi:MOSC domain-containing protein YiiM
MVTHLSMAELQARQADLGQSPQDKGKLEMIVIRPGVDERKVLERAELDPVDGLVGDNWRARGSSGTEDGSAHPDAQIAIMNSRVIQLVAQERSRWPLAGDQLFIDLDLSRDNLQPGQRIAIGTALLEITGLLHSGCEKFTERFGHDAIRFVNSSEGRHFRRRGIYARVIQSGVICAGDMVSKVETPR